MLTIRNLNNISALQHAGWMVLGAWESPEYYDIELFSIDGEYKFVARISRRPNSDNPTDYKMVIYEQGMNLINRNPQLNINYPWKMSDEPVTADTLRKPQRLLEQLVAEYLPKLDLRKKKR